MSHGPTVLQVEVRPIASTDDTECARCAGNGYTRLEADEDGAYGIECLACAGTGRARYCESCIETCEPAVHELRAGDRTFRVCFRGECMGEGVLKLLAAQSGGARRAA